MYKVSVVGIDNSGKTSVVKSLDKMGATIIHLTTYQNTCSKVAGHIGKLLNNLAKFGEEYDLTSLTGFVYLLHLIPYWFEERTKKTSSLIVSDRDPIIDTLCYSDSYLPDGLSRIIRPSLKFILEHTFDYPNLFVYLEATPEISTSRNSKRSQLHDEIKSLSRLKELFEEGVSLAEINGVSIIRIDTNDKSLEEVIGEVQMELRKFM